MIQISLAWLLCKKKIKYTKNQFFKTTTKHRAIEKRSFAHTSENSIHVALFMFCLFLKHRTDDTCFSWCFTIRGICFVLGITKHLDVLQIMNFSLFIYLFCERFSWSLRWPRAPYTLEGDLELTFLPLPPTGRFISLKVEKGRMCQQGSAGI